MERAFDKANDLEIQNRKKDIGLHTRKVLGLVIEKEGIKEMLPS
jgi:hypothetical protein